jgi:hypothetical protein
VNCTASPSGKLLFVGFTLIEVADTVLTVSEAVFEIAPDVAVMVVLPPAMACARPCVGEALPMVATAVLDEVQLTDPVMFCLLPSLNVPVAVNC